MKNKIFSLLLVLLTVALLLCGCGQNGSVAEDAGYSSIAASGDSVSYSLSSAKKISANTASDVGITLSDSEITDGSKLIKTAYATIKTENYEDTLKKIQDRIDELGGRIDKESYNGYVPRTAALTVRIPVEKYTQFTGEFNSFGVVTSLSASIDDVTTDYAELLAEKETLEDAIDFYEKLMTKCTTIKEQNEIENELDTRKTRLKRIEASIATLADKVAYSTIYLTLDEVKSEEEVKKDTLFKRIADTFGESWNDLKEGVEDAIVWFCGNILEIVLWCGLLVGGFFLLRYLVRKKRSKASVKKIVESSGEEPKNG